MIDFNLRNTTKIPIRCILALHTVFAAGLHLPSHVLTLFCTVKGDILFPCCAFKIAFFHCNFPKLSLVEATINRHFLKSYQAF